MTIKRYEEIDCPNCGASNNILIWDSINAQLNPEAKTALLCGEINVFACERCGNTARIEKGLLYHDMESKFMVWYFPFEWVQNGDIFDSVTPDGQPKGLECFSGGYSGSIQYVFDMNELVRYIKFRDVLAEKLRQGSD